MQKNNIREQFVSKFSVLVNSVVGMEVAEKITPLLTEFLADYEIESRNTEIAVYEIYIPDWLEEYFVCKCVAGCKERSMKDYAYHINHFFEYIHMPISEITESDIQKYIGYCLRKKENSRSYVDHKRIVINDFFKWSLNKGYLTSNPCHFIPPIHSSRTSRIPYTDDELTKIRNEVTDLRDKAIIETFISTACRVEELCRLNISDIDFNEGTVQLFGKGDKHRTSYMNSEMKHALNKYLGIRTDDNNALFVGNRLSRTTGKRERVTTQGIQALTRRISNNIGVDSIQPHRFRRTTATNMSNSGCNLSDIQRFLGHANPNITARYIYNNVDNMKMIHKKFVH